jgi:Uri superfamily endonuclease
LLLRLRSSAQIQVGKLGEFFFPAGWYVYSGSARRLMRHRLERHFRGEKKTRWHIDYLTTSARADMIGAVMFDPEAAAEAECGLNRRVGALLGLVQTVPGFGASDCRNGCGAHLWYTAKPVSLLQLAQAAPRASFLLPG